MALFSLFVALDRAELPVYMAARRLVYKSAARPRQMLVERLAWLRQHTALLDPVEEAENMSLSSAGDEVDARVHAYRAQHGVSYAAGLDTALRADREGSVGQNP